MDIQNIFMNFEHSYMGDITITFICPNGGSILVHQQGGGGTFLGEPVDDDGDPDKEHWYEEANRIIEEYYKCIYP
jgi:subtilisin-like proprotein convertase family protein